MNPITISLYCYCYEIDVKLPGNIIQYRDERVSVISSFYSPTATIVFQRRIEFYFVNFGFFFFLSILRYLGFL